MKSTAGSTEYLPLPNFPLPNSRKNTSHCYANCTNSSTKKKPISPKYCPNAFPNNPTSETSLNSKWSSSQSSSWKSFITDDTPKTRKDLQEQISTPNHTRDTMAQPIEDDSSNNKQKKYILPPMNDIYKNIILQLLYLLMNLLDLRLPIDTSTSDFVTSKTEYPSVEDIQIERIHIILEHLEKKLRTNFQSQDSDSTNAPAHIKAFKILIQIMINQPIDLTLFEGFYIFDENSELNDSETYNQANNHPRNKIPNQQYSFKVEEEINKCLENMNFYLPKDTSILQANNQIEKLKEKNLKSQVDSSKKEIIDIILNSVCSGSTYKSYQIS